MICSSCGREIPDASAFCTFCGAPVQPAEPVASVEQPVPPIEPVTSVEQPAPIESVAAEEPPVVPPAPPFETAEQTTVAAVAAPAIDDDLVAPYIPPQPDVPAAPDFAEPTAGQYAYTPVQAPAPDPTQVGETTASIPPQQQDYGFAYTPPQQGGAAPQPGANPLPGGYAPQQGGYPPPQGGYAPQQGGYPPPIGAPTNYEPPKKKKTWIIVLVIVLVVLCCVAPAVTAGVMAATGFFDQNTYGGGSSVLPDNTTPPAPNNNGGGTSGTITESQLIGTWREIDIDDTYVFNADGTGTERYEGSVWDMTWSLNGTTLRMDFPGTGAETYEIEYDGVYLIVHTPIVDYEYVKQ